MFSISSIGQRISRIYEGFLIRNGKAIKPKSMLYITTMRCQSRCNMCNIWQIKEHNDLPLDGLENKLNNDLFNQIKTLQLSGGEVFINPYITGIVSLFLKKLPSINNLGLATNALSPLLIQKRLNEIIPLCERLKSITIQISIHGIGEIHNKIMGLPNAFENFEKTLNMLFDLKKINPRIDIRLNCVVQEVNIDNLIELYNYAMSQNLIISFSPIIYSPQYYENKKNQILKEQQLVKLKDFLTKISNKDNSLLGYYHKMVIKMLNGEKRSFGCQFGRSLIMLEHDGNIHPCMNAENIVFGNILKDNINKIWFSDKTNELRKQLYKNHCETCQASCGINPYEYLKYTVFHSPFNNIKTYLNK